MRQNPLCAECMRRGQVARAVDVDHIDGFDGVEDPKRLDRARLQSLCRACHNEKTGKQRNR